MPGFNSISPVADDHVLLFAEPASVMGMVQSPEGCIRVVG